MTTLHVEIRRLAHAADLPLPTRASPGAAGLDLLAAVERSVELKPGDQMLIPTGLSLALPDGYEGQIRPRSGLALNYGVTVLNTPGTIDSDYRGEVGVVLINHGRAALRVDRGMRIAQLVVAPYPRVHWEEVETHSSSTRRNAGGFGSTGLDHADDRALRTGFAAKEIDGC